ncbi:S-adenosyl-L-methionine-dependent methyltransferase [Meira miltonrushii]|uniref:S-adenosyl-L-methionine-dependent methyltransferase n=1 Tax=Meira miltonrushii TaxID=1280837 RepID=A0A316VFQ1_9BASI|nr:S-adenosyl-L-methionine-dependent methyltransferase [Meira miltonrushii]PWN36360.1 S-adenosyl-L-methionine-dependent methyltransferase [Meira miltonrushii]
MPRGGKGGRGRRGAKHGGGIARSRDDGGRSNTWQSNGPAMQTNKYFEAYYWDQNIVNPDQWQAFLDHLRAPLPTSFRITSGKPTTAILIEQMQNFYLPYLSNVKFEGEQVPPPKALPWYPESMGWQIDVKKNALRKTEQFQKFQQFLVHETEVGNISRQETVSMIPPLFLNVEPHHIVLDMCAAPGSKTAQLIEALHSPLTTMAESYDPCPPGIVIANDADAKRAHMLVHQSARLPSPNIVVANCDASRWPSVRVPWNAKGSESVQERTMKFDRVLADVPCSGDGTLRKNLMIWKDWHPHNGSSLHPLQLRILMRGLQSLRNGGRLVYSTCSLNPIEDEAVVAQALRDCKGTVKLVDQSHAFPELIRKKGVFTWKVCPTKGSKDKLNVAKTAEGETEGEQKSEEKIEGEQKAEEKTEGGEGSSYRDTLPQLPYVEKHDDLAPEWREKVPKSLWPQGDEEALGLDKCMRILPQDQNTGGFFVAVLEKDDGSEPELSEGMAHGMVRAMGLKDATVSKQEAANTAKRPLNGDEEEESNKRVKTDADVAGDANGAGPSNGVAVEKKPEDIGQPGGAPYREDPMVYVDQNNEQSQSIVSFFGLTDKFDKRNLLVRNRDANPLRSAYFTSTSVRALITCGGAGKGDHPYGNPLKMRLINSGVRSFARQDSGKDPQLKCKWRVTSDAIPVLRPLIEAKKILHASISDFAFMISNHYPKLSDVPEGDFRTALQNEDIGSHLVDIAPGTYQDQKLERTICVPIWRAPASMNLMLERQEKSALSYRIFGKDLSNPSGARQFVVSKAQKQAQAQANAKRQQKEEQSMKIDEDELEALENAAASTTAAKEEQEQQEETAAQVEEEGQELSVDV